MTKKIKLNSFMKEIILNTQRVEAEQEALKPSETQIGHLMNGRYEEWNETMKHFREEFPDKLLNLKGYDLRGKDLSGFDLGSIDFAGSKFCNVKMDEDTIIDEKTRFVGVSIDYKTLNNLPLDLTSRWNMCNPKAREIMKENSNRDAEIDYQRY